MTPSLPSRPCASPARRLFPVLAFTVAFVTATALPNHALVAQSTFPAGAIQGPQWRHIGPFRAGRTKSAVGVPTQPNVFYMAATNGGVWKTNDAGRTWKPIFDAQPTGSIGAVEVAPSNPDIIYVGSGEGLHRPDLSTGDGMYRSNDAGRTWTHLGLRDGQQIPRIAVDPRNPERLFVAVLGHPYGPNPERGIYRSTNGGREFERVLYKDENTGGADVVLSPDDPNTVYAVLWEARQGPWENAAWSGGNSGLFKSTDGGGTWTQLAGGLPTTADGVGRFGIGISPSNPRRIYVTATAGAKSGVYRSDDAGASWTRTTTDNRVFGRGDDFASITVDPRDPNTLYSMNVVAWKSTDAGVTWKAFRGAPGGDDYQRLWINPLQPDLMLMVADQGAVITVNGGETWSSWYNQGTAQFYHVTTDNAWPYRVCGGQQESGSACVSSRGNDGSITLRDWRPVGASEYSYVAPDPLNPDIVYGGTVTRFDRRTGQTQNVSPNAGRGRGGAGGTGPDYFRGIRTMPILFSPINKRKLYYGTNVVWETVNGGTSWKRLSGDLSRKTWAVPSSVGKYASTPAAQPTQRGVVYTIAPSPVDSNTVWAGTDDGLIHVTRNGGRTWQDVTPPQLGPWWKVSIMDASHRDANTAYAAVNTFRLDDLRPHIYRTRDGGKTWTEIVTGMAVTAPVNVVREDPVRRGLLFAGTEHSVWFSLDDGDHWHPLRANMPVISIRDLVIKDDDLAIGTHGRGFWIFDNITALRQWTPAVETAPSTLFKPATATRVRYSMYTDTPVPPDEPRAENPPDGAMIDYYLARDAARVDIEILNAAGRVVRRYSSTDPTPAPVDAGNWPAMWFRPAKAPSTKAGLQRFPWDLHYTRPTTDCSLPISGTPYNTKCEPEGPWVMPGLYSVRLTVDGAVHTEKFAVRMDPRVTTPVAALRQQHDLSVALYDAMLESATLSSSARARGDSALAGPQGFGGIAAAHASVISALQGSDAPPTAVVVSTAKERLAAFAALKARAGSSMPKDAPSQDPAPRFEPLQPELFATGGSFANAFADIDSDGDLDLFVGFGASPNRLYENTRGVFRDIAAAAGVADARATRAAAWSDIDADGDPDLLLGFTPGAGGVLRLYRNDRGRFTDITRASGLLVDTGAVRQPVFLDVEGDGDIDLFVAFRDKPNVMYLNDGGAFTDAAARLGLADARKTVGAVWFDYQQDGDLDLYVANQDGGKNGFFRNDGGRFTDVADAIGLAWGGRAADVATQGTVRPCVADVNNDGIADIINANYGTNGLFLGARDGTFRDVGTAWGLGVDGRHDTCAPADIDHDGRLDVYVNGTVSGTESFRDYLFVGKADRFVDVTPPNVLALGASHGVAWADVDGDGALDLALASSRADTPHALLRNALPAERARRSLQVRVLDGNGRAIRAGSEVRVYAAGSSRLLGTRWVDTGSGYNAQSDGPVHFGLAGSAPVDVEVIVPSRGARARTIVRGVKPADYAGRWLTVRAAGR
ncbi:MAG: FG-GAP-like repeat-containing protein [Gemmatimonadota bacterium]